MISVLLPVYNGEKFIKEAIDSILNQTFKEFELLILNDGSTDNTEQSIKSFSDSRIKYFALKHKGLPATLNFGLKKAKYNYIARMDSDDICNQNRFEKQIEFLKAQPEIGLVGTNITIVDKKRGTKKYVKLPENDKNIKKLLPSKCCIAHPTIMFKKEILLKVGGYNINEIVEDWALYLKLIDVIKFHNLQENLLTLQLHGNNLSIDINNKKFRKAEEKVAYSYYLNRIKKNSLQKEKANALFDLGYFYYLRDDNKFKRLFKQAVRFHKANFRYVYFLIVGIHLRPFVLIMRKFGLIKMFYPFKKLDKNNLFFRNEF